MSFRVTFTPVVLVKITVSLPAPPSRTLLAMLPTKMSLPVAARGVLDQGAGVVVVEQRHGDVAGRQRRQVLEGEVVGQLGLVEGGELARAQVDGDAVGVVAGVDRVVAAAVPDGEEDLVARRRALADAVDEHLAGASG